MSELAPGSRYGSFQITNKLGRGLTGTVYRAVYLKDGTHVALKFLEQRDESVKSYFFNEMGLLRRAKEHSRNHQHLVEYVASYTTQEPYCLATRFYEGGQELTEFLRNGIVPGLALRIVEQAAGALDYLHYGHPDAPVVHRDIKPANLMVNTAGDVLVIDLSAARHPNFMLENERGLGTPQYMPPEQYEGDEQPQTDQFALAVVAYQMLTGKTILGTNPDREHKQMTALRDSGYTRVREAMRGMPATAEVIVRAVAFDWHLRYQTCEEFAYELHLALANDGVALEVTAMPPPRAASKQWLGYAVMAVVVVVSLVLLIANPFDSGGQVARPTAAPPTVAQPTGQTSSIVLDPPSDSGTKIAPTSDLLPTTGVASGAGGGGQVSPVGDGCALRESPSTGARVLSHVATGVPLSILGQQGDWYNVRLSDGSSGWCPGYQLSIGAVAAPVAARPAPARPAAPPAPPAPAPQSVPPTAVYEPPTVAPEPPPPPPPPTATPAPLAPPPSDNGGGGSGGGNERG